MSVTNHYARAMADVLLEQPDPATRMAEVHNMAGILASNPDLRQVWETPSIPDDQKRRLLDAIVAKAGVSKPVRNFLAVLIDNGRIPMLEQIVKQLDAEIAERLNLAQAEVISARELGAQEKQQLEQQVARMTGKKVRAKYATDPALLGGAVIRLGSTIYDGSVRGQLERIKEQIQQ
jgi:F-type H+-transporting ATPase subunit delta